MASELYFADDGTIHRRDGHKFTVGENHDGIHKGSERVDGSVHGVCYNIRQCCFWIISIVIALIVSVALKGAALEMFSEGEGNLFEVIAPYTCMICSLAGSVLYGIFYAKKQGYSFGCYFLSVLSNLGGGIGGIIVAGAIYVTVTALLFALVVFVIFEIILAMLDA